MITIFYRTWNSKEDYEAGVFTEVVGFKAKTSESGEHYLSCHCYDAARQGTIQRHVVFKDNYEILPMQDLRQQDSPTPIAYYKEQESQA